MLDSKRKRKMAIVMFADIIGFTKMSETMDAEEVINLLNIVWRDIDRIILDKNGIIDKHNGDNVIALWSIEHTSKDDPIYAAEVALEILDTMSRVSVEREVGFRVGIHYGPLIAGEIGLRDEFTVIGDTVNLAARLESTAENNTIQVSTDFAYLIQNRFNLERLGFISVKGKTEPVETYRVLSINEDYNESNFIYFDNRLSEFNDLLEANSYNGNFVILGDRGIGKSELMFESYQLISDTFKDSYLLQVEPSNRSESLSSAAMLLKNIMKKNPELAISFNKNCKRIEYNIINLLISNGNNEDKVDKLSDELVFSAFVKFMNFYISFNNLENIVLYVDELKNIDKDSLNIFSKMIDGFLNKPFLFVTNGVINSYNIECIEYNLKNIELETAMRLVDELGYDLDESKIEKIHSQTDGNLLFFLELVKYMNKTKSDKLPPNLNNLIQIQIESLSTETLKVVNYSSIPGYVINYNFLTVHLDQKIVDDAIKELVNSAIIHKDTKTFSYRFSNKYFFDQVYEGTLLSERKSIHLLYAKWLEKTKSTEYNEIAYHYMKAAELNIAFEKYMDVARRTGDKGLNYGCYAVCNIIEGFLDKIDVEYCELVEYYRYFAMSLYKTDNREKAPTILEKAYSLVQDNNDDKAYKQLILLDVMNNHEGKGSERLNLTKSRIENIYDDDSQELVALRHFIIGTLAYRSGDYNTHETEFIKTIEIAKSKGLFEIVGMAQSTLGALYTLQGKYDEAIEILEESIAIQNKFSTDLSSNARALIGVAEIHGDTGNEKKREEYLDKTIKILQDSNRGYLYVLAMQNMAECKLKLGQTKDFIKFLKESIPYALKIGSVGSIAFACIVYARYLFGENRINEAYEYIGTSFNTIPNYVPVMEYVANIIYGDFDNIDMPNKEELISKGRKRDPMKEINNILEKLDAIK